MVIVIYGLKSKASDSKLIPIFTFV